MNDETPESVAGGEGRVDVRLDRETVWLTQRQMAEVFDSTPENVLMQLRNIFASGELEAGATTKEFLAVRTEGRRRVRHRILAQLQKREENVALRRFVGTVCASTGIKQRRSSPGS